MPKLNEMEARKYLKILKESETEGRFVSYVWGTLGPKKRKVFVVSKKNGAGVRGKANGLFFEKGDKFSVTGSGVCRLQENVLFIAGFNNQSPKGSISNMKACVKGFCYDVANIKALLFTEIRVAQDVTIDESEFLDASADEPVVAMDDDDLIDAMHEVVEERGESFDQYGEGAEATGISQARPHAKPGEGQVEPGNETAFEDRESNEKTASDDKADKLDLAVQTEISGKLEAIVSTLMSVAQSIGMPMSGKQADIVAKLYSWLERILLALPPEQRQAAANNWLARLQLAISSSMQSMRDASVAVSKQKESDDGESKMDEESQSVSDTGAQSEQTEDEDVVGGVSLKGITTDEPSEDEVVRAVFAKGIEAIQDLNKKRSEADLPVYDASVATDDRLRQMVKGALARGGSTADAITRLFATLDKAFHDPNILLRYFDIPLVPQAQSASRIETVPDQPNIPQLIATWEAGHTKAYAMVEALKLAVDDRLREERTEWSVASLGGSWQLVDDIFKFVQQAEVSRDLSAVEVADQRDLPVAVKNALETVNRNIEFLKGHAIVEAIDNNPFKVVVTVGNTLSQSLEAIKQRLGALTAEAV